MFQFLDLSKITKSLQNLKLNYLTKNLNNEEFCKQCFAGLNSQQQGLPVEQDRVGHILAVQPPWRGLNPGPGTPAVPGCSLRTARTLAPGLRTGTPGQAGILAGWREQRG